jgi:O-antigen ligase
LFLLPVLFLPNFGLGRDTSFGALEFSDYIIGFYLLLLWPGARRTVPCRGERLGHLAVAFVAWAFLGAATVNLRYDYGADTRALYFGLLKLAKLVLYGWAGLLTARALKDGGVRRQFHWSLLAVIVVLGVSLLVGPGKEAAAEAARSGYKASNGASVGMAILVSYVGGLLLCRHGSQRWKWASASTVAVGLAGSLVSGGRGGWLAVIGAAAYFLWRRGPRAATIGLCAGFLLVGFLAYQLFPDFSERLRFTVGVEGAIISSAPTQEADRFAGIDQGGRTSSWFWQAPKLLDAPILGTGFFHRGGLSPLDWWGSHNFFLQMLLETGVVGGVLMLLALRRMWLDAGSRGAQQALLTIPLRGAFVAAFVGGMGGEYFYGGTVLLVLFLIYAPAGGLPLMGSGRVRGRRRWRALHDTPGLGAHALLKLDRYPADGSRFPGGS